MDEKIIMLSDMLEKKAKSEANCYPVDRYFLEPYLQQILKVNRNHFMLYNLERMNNTYVVQLLLCLPELGQNLYVDDVIEIINGFSNIFSFYAFIEFTYKYVEVNIVELILELPSVSIKNKQNILHYLISSFYPNLIKSDGDYLFFKEGLYGVQPDAWAYTKQVLLIDKRIKPALTNLTQLEKYFKSLAIH
jgi:hypothetical protein